VLDEDGRFTQRGVKALPRAVHQVWVG
jgi:hypothetical protein